MLWRNSLKMFLEYPILGVGPGHWKLYFPQYGVSGWYLDKGLIQFSTPHNDLLWILTEYGLFGFLAFVALILNIIKGFWRKINRDNKSMLNNLLLLCGFIAYLSDSFFSYPRERALHVVLFATYTALSAYEIKKSKNWKLIALLLTYLMIPLNGYISFLFYSRLNAEKHLAIARKAIFAQNWEVSIRESQICEKLGMDYTPFYIEPVALIQGMANDELNRRENAYLCYERAYKNAPFNLSCMVQYAGVLHAQNNNGEALAIIDKSLKITPGYWYSCRLKSLILLKEKRIDEAWEALNNYSFFYDREYDELSSEIFRARLIQIYETLPEGHIHLECLKYLLETGNTPNQISKIYNSQEGVMLWLKENCRE
jgi:tetratricopeptide (TPR) repeat protein